MCLIQTCRYIDDKCASNDYITIQNCLGQDHICLQWQMAVLRENRKSLHRIYHTFQQMEHSSLGVIRHTGLRRCLLSGPQKLQGSPLRPLCVSLYLRVYNEHLQLEILNILQSGSVFTRTMQNTVEIINIGLLLNFTSMYLLHQRNQPNSSQNTSSCHCLKHLQICQMALFSEEVYCAGWLQSSHFQ